MKAPRLKTLAAQINEKFPDLVATVERGYCNTDFKPKGCRYITRTGKGREGNRLIVKLRSTGKVVLDHNSAEAYRSNEEVVERIKKWGKKVECPGCGRMRPGSLMNDFSGKCVFCLEEVI